MLKKIKLLSLFILHFANQTLFATRWISLGDACASALALRSTHRRREAYPFDWIVTNFSALCQVLEEDFKHFFTDVRPLGDAKNNGVVDHYGLHFPHDFPTIHSPASDPLTTDFMPGCGLVANWQNYLPAVTEKYRRRIERFRQACQGTEKVFFVRNDTITKEEATVLRDLLRQKYPQLPFTLVMVSSNLEDKEPWNIEGIVNAYVSVWCQIDEWNTIFTSIDPTIKLYKQPKSISALDLVCPQCVIEGVANMPHRAR